MDVEWVRWQNINDKQTWISGCGRWVIVPSESIFKIQKGARYNKHNTEIGRYPINLYRLLDRDDTAAWDEAGFQTIDYDFQLGTIAVLKRLTGDIEQTRLVRKRIKGRDRARLFRTRRREARAHRELLETP
jgi:hypothetical protein